MGSVGWGLRTDGLGWVKKCPTLLQSIQPVAAADVDLVAVETVEVEYNMQFPTDTPTLDQMIAGTADLMVDAETVDALKCSTAGEVDRDSSPVMVLYQCMQVDFRPGP